MRTWTTDTRPNEQLFSYWREVLCEAFVLLDPVLKSDATRFRGHVESRALYSTSQARIASRAQTNSRRWEEIRRNPVEFCFANFLSEGSCVVRQDGREALVSPGNFFIVDTTRPYHLDFREDWSVLSFRIPRNQLASRLAEPRLATARAVRGDTGLGLVASRFAQSLDQLADDASVETQEGLSTALNSVIALALGATFETKDADRVSARKALRQAVETYIVDHLADPELTPETIATRFGVSRRTLYSVFEDNSLSVVGLIREQRLLRSARDLLTAKSGNVLAIAMRWGFNDASHYSRLFKSRFGVSPRDFASQSLAVGEDQRLSRLIGREDLA
ncbi:AraC-like ligand-binding domain-containing protein [Paraburkholderia sediminicola]|uniref:AraC-like ligand-binding domain-containing protein n=1 Tax=Paraburkholderia sediminicola TaxID=458836 RepID=UPI0038BB6A62